MTEEFPVGKTFTYKSCCHQVEMAVVAHKGNKIEVEYVSRDKLITRAFSPEILRKGMV